MKRWLGWLSVVLLPCIEGYVGNDEAPYLANFAELIRDSYSAPRPGGLDECVNQGVVAAPATVTTAGHSSLDALGLKNVCGSDICEVAEGTVVTISSSISLYALVIKGSVVWSQASAEQWLCAGYVAVEEAGSFTLENGDPTKRSFIYIMNNGATHPQLRTRAFGGVALVAGKVPTITVTGAPMQRTWSLLARPLTMGAQMEVTLLHDPAAMGWRVGDRVVVGPTNAAGSTGQTYGHFIKELPGGNRMFLAADPSLAAVATADQDWRAESRWAGPKGHVAQLHAEVINLSRNVVVTGDDLENQACDGAVTDAVQGCQCDGARTTCTFGLHTLMIGKGQMQFQYTRAEKCGQRGVLGKYCFHMHLMEACPECLFRGNAVEYSHQRGLVIHGTHLATVEHNVFNDVRGANLYIEDGGELFNTIQYNVAICPWPLIGNNAAKHGCTVPGTDNDQADTAVNQAGLWALSMSNNLIGNRFSNHFNGMFYQTTMRHGRQTTAGKVCVRSHPVGRMDGNTFHGGGRFGTYFLGDNFPKAGLAQSLASNGMVQFLAAGGSRGSADDPCAAFTADGSTHGLPVALTNNLDYNNAFVGQYDAGDIQYRGHMSVDNNNLIYWKTTKNMEDGCSSHIHGSYYDGNGGQMALPGGYGAFLIEDTVFVNNVVLEPNHHCNAGTTGVMCADSVYVLIASTWDVTSTGRWIRYEQSANNFGGAVTMAPGEAPNGFFPKNLQYVSTASDVHAWLLDLPDGLCTLSADIGLAQRYANGILCKRGMRRLTVWTRDAQNGVPLIIDVWRGTDKVATATVDWFTIGSGIGAVTSRQGYALPLIPTDDLEYRLSLSGGGDIPADWIIEFSDPVFGNRWPGDELNTINLRVQGRTCAAQTSVHHDRKWIYGDSVDLLRAEAFGRGACTTHADTAPINCGTTPQLTATTCDDCGQCPANSYCQCGTAVCACNPGFFGDNCEKDICAVSRCAHGRCTARYLGGTLPVSMAACACEPGWAGPVCDFQPCATQTCSGHGHCIPRDTAYECVCEKDWTGQDCERATCTDICPPWGGAAKFVVPYNEATLRANGERGWCAINYENRWDTNPRDITTPDSSEGYCCFANCHACAFVVCDGAPDDCHRAGRCQDGTCTAPSRVPDGTLCNSQLLGTCQAGVCIASSNPSWTLPPTLPAASVPPTPAPVSIVVDTFSTYPGYTGTLQVEGSVELFFADDTVSVAYSLFGVEVACTAAGDASGSCGLHIHEGYSCATAGGHFYETAADPWADSIYVAETGSAETEAPVPACDYEGPLAKNAYDGAGGIGIDIDPVAVPLSECISRCSSTPACDCIVVVPCESVDCSCWMREQCVEAEMPDSTSYNVYIKDRATCVTPQTPNATLSKAQGSFTVDHGADYSATAGRTIVLHDFEGKRFACATFGDREPSVSAAQVRGPCTCCLMLTLVLLAACVRW